MSPRKITPGAELAKRRLDGDQPWYWLYAFQVPTDPVTMIRLVSSIDGQSQGVVFGTTSTGQGVTWQPFPVTHSPIKEDNRSSLDDLNVVVGNANRAVQFYVDNYDLIGQPAILRFVLASELQSGVASIEERYEILGIESNARQVSLRCGRPNILQEAFPKELATRTTCRFPYRGARCGYVGVGLSSCDKTLDGPNGCEVHGAQEVAEGLTKLHPARIGSYPGMPIE